MACTEGIQGDADCTDRDPAQPYCVGGACAECREDNDCAGQFCDVNAGVCTACTDSFQCQTGACDRDSGLCVPETEIIYVDRANADADDLGPCDSAVPCQTIGGAVNRINLDLDARRVIVVRGDATMVYGESLTLDGITATLIGSAAIQPIFNQPGIVVSNSSDITIESIHIIGAAGTPDPDGIRCSGEVGLVPRLRLYRVTIANNSATGVEAINCAVSISQSIISSNDQGGLYLRDSAFDIANNFLVKNGDIVNSNIGGVVIDNFGVFDQAQREFSFNTVVLNQANSIADAKGVRCRSDNPVTAIGNIVYGNVGDAPTVSGTCTWAYSNIEGGAAGAGNIDAAPVFVDAPGNDFHLQPGSPGIDVDGLACNDVPVDFDGDTRPQNQLCDMGADEVTP